MSQFEVDLDQIAAFDDDGFFIVEKLLDREETDLLRDIARADPGAVAGAASRADGEGGAVKVRVENELGEADIYSAIVRSRRIVEGMETLLCDEVYHYHHKMILKEPARSAAPGPGTRITDTGTTTAACSLSGQLHDRCRPGDEENGCLQVLRGSHHLGRVNHVKIGDKRVPIPNALRPPASVWNSCTASWSRVRPFSSTAICCIARTRTRATTPLGLHLLLQHQGERPYKESRHPRYSPLAKWPDSMVLEIGRRQWSHATTGSVSEREAAASLSAAVKAETLRIGFDLRGRCLRRRTGHACPIFRLAGKGFAGEMEYLGRREEAYAHPRHVMPAVRSIMMLAANYRTADPVPPPLESLSGSLTGRVSRYAWNNGDYHSLLRERLERLADFLHAQRPDCRTRATVDTAPLLKRDFARAAGLGWFGKNTMLIHKRQGSWLFLAGLLTDADLEPDAPHETSHCGTCTRCLEACPTDAFPAAYVLDARNASRISRSNSRAPCRPSSATAWALAVWLRRLPGCVPLEQKGSAQRRRRVSPAPRS